MTVVVEENAAPSDISSVPKVLYADGNWPTRVDDEGIFAGRTMLRLNIGLGSQQLYTRSR